MEDKDTKNQEDENNEIKININKQENNQLKGGEAFLGVLKDEEEKKEEDGTKIKRRKRIQKI